MIGNDVVDLRDPETCAGSLHPRFDARVMAASERAWLAGRPTPDRDRWMLWAAKEAAYKAMRRMNPTIAFSPVRFLVALDDDGVGTLTVGETVLEVLVRIIDDAVHAVASFAGTPRDAILAECLRGAGRDPSAAARRLAIDVVAARAEGAEASVAMRGRLPELQTVKDATIPLSLAHHGDVVGFAVQFPLSVVATPGDRS
jgi:phosphopantetheinyl transferase (holo-ACP synthase)